MYLGYPRFWYDGYSFIILDPWPDYWPVDWFETDPLYITYDYDSGGYYLHDANYPRIELAIDVLG
jgi:hypothetical protein